MDQADARECSGLPVERFGLASIGIGRDATFSTTDTPSLCTSVSEGTRRVGSMGGVNDPHPLVGETDWGIDVLPIFVLLVLINGVALSGRFCAGAQGLARAIEKFALSLVRRTVHPNVLITSEREGGEKHLQNVAWQ
ncbi:MAG: hypothetical protein V1800_17390 [Candidatus Latescibacterota bacterium]